MHNSNIDSKYQPLHNTLREFAVYIYSQGAKGEYDSAVIFVPTLKQIQTAFEKRDYRKITNMLVKFVNLANDYLDPQRALSLMDAALESPLKNERHHSLFFHHRTCGQVLEKCKKQMQMMNEPEKRSKKSF